MGPGGFTVVSDQMSVLSGFGTTITSQGTWVFATDGRAVDGSTGHLVGQYPASGPLWPTADGRDVWFLTSGPTLQDFERTTFLQRRAVSLPANAGGASDSALVGWSSTGFAYRTGSAVCVVTVAP